MASNIVNGITSIVVARLLGPTNFALYGIALTLPTLLFSFSNLGVDQAIIRYVARLQQEGSIETAWRILKAGYAIRLAVALVSMSVGFVIASSFTTEILLRTGIVGFVQLATITVPLQASFWYSYQGFKGINRMSLSAVVRSLQAVSKAVISIALIWLGFSILGAITGFVLSYALAGLSGIVALWYMAEKQGGSEANEQVVKIRDVVKFGLSLYMLTILSDGINQVRLILLANNFDDVLIGNFNAASNLSVILLGFTVALVGVLFPAFSRLSARLSPSQMSNAFNRALNYVALPVIPVAFLTIAMADQISLFLYGVDYEITPEFLRFLALIPLAIVLGANVMESFMNGIGKSRYSLLIWMSYFTVFLATAFMLIGTWGIIGVIIAQLIGRVVSSIIGLGLASFFLQVNLDIRRIIPILVSASISYILLSFIAALVEVNPIVWLFVGSLLFLLIFITILPLIKGIRMDDLDMMLVSFKPMPIIRFIVRLFVAYEKKLLKVLERKSSSDGMHGPQFQSTIE